MITRFTSRTNDRLGIAGFLGLLATLSLRTAALADTTWPAGSTQTLALDYLVIDTLTIEAGVTVNVGAGARILIGGTGTLIVNGTADDPVVFTSIDAARWGGITFQADSTGNMHHAIVTHAAPFGISVVDSAPTIAHCVVQDIASDDPSVAAAGLSVSGVASRPSILDSLIEGVVGATGTQPATADTGSNGSNGANGTNLAPNGENGTAGGTGDTGVAGSGGGAAYGINVTSGSAAILLRNRIREITGGTGGIGGKGGKGGKGGSGGDGVSGVGSFNGSGGNGASGGKGGKGGKGGAGGVATGIRFFGASDNASAVESVLIDAITGGTGGLGGTGGTGGNGGGGGDGADCNVPGCAAGDGGDAGGGGDSGAGGQTGNGGATHALFFDTSATLAHATIAGIAPGSDENVVPPESNCLYPNGGIGCDNPACTATVCAVDPFCCEVTWDALCANEAAQMCAVTLVANPGTPGDGGSGGNGGDAFFEAQDGDDGSDAGPGDFGAIGSSGANGATDGLVADDSMVEVLNSVVDLGGSPNATAFVTQGDGSIVVQNSCVHGYTQLSTGGDVVIEDSLLLDPQFANPDSGDYALASNSPCIDSAHGVIAFKRQATAWIATVHNAPAHAFDEFYPGFSGALGCLAESPTITLAGGALTATSALDNGNDDCALVDGSTPSMVSDGSISGINGSHFALDFDPPVLAFYTFYGSVAIGAQIRMRVFDGNEEIATLLSAPSGHNSQAMGHGFIAPRAIDHIEFESLTDPAVLVGAFVGMSAGEQSLGTANIRGYNGPQGANVQCDFAVGFVDSVEILDINGDPRIVDGDEDDTPVADMGAFEFQTAVPCPSDVNGNGAIDASDLAIVLGAWGPCASCSADINDDGVVNASDLAILLGAWGPCL